MKPIVLTTPSFAFIVATRAVLGMGVGLLASTRMPADRRRRVGAALLAVGAATTIPAVMQLIRGRRRFSVVRRTAADRDPRLIGATRFARKGDDVD